jgi:hypothetical protein
MSVCLFGPCCFVYVLACEQALLLVDIPIQRVLPTLYKIKNVTRIRFPSLKYE